eukprot:756805-Hanusia_phi.AAC.4
MALSKMSSDSVGVKETKELLAFFLSFSFFFLLLSPMGLMGRGRAAKQGSEELASQLVRSRSHCPSEHEKD